MKKPLLLFTLLLIAATTYAQSYAEKAEEIKKTVWGDPAAEFKLKEVPAKYSNESAVILAQAFNMQRTSNVKFKFLIVSAAITNKVSRISTLHERVKINDKSALERYSSLEYQKRLDKSISLLIANFSNLHETYIGAKIIKPSGQEVLVNTGEEVLLKNTGNDQKGKLAIPGLQVGDILDYYITTNDLSERSDEDTFQNNDQIFVLADEYPVVNYSLNFQFNKKAAVYYIAANGAPKFTESVLENGDKVYNLKLKDLPKYESQKWTSVYRQLPYIEISNTSSIRAMTASASNKGGFADNKQRFEDLFNEQINPIDEEPVKRLKDYFDGKKNLRAASLDSSMKVLYDIWKLGVFGEFSKDDLDDMSRINYRRANSKRAAINISRVLTDMEIPHEVLLVSSREANSLQNAFHMSDFDAMLKIYNGNKPLYMSFDEAVTHFNEIPARYQGEKAITLTPDRRNSRKYEFVEGQTTLPVAPAENNRIDQQLQVWLMTDMQKIKVQRQVKQTGYMSHNDQKGLLSAMDIDNGLQELAKGDPLEKRLSKNWETKRSASAFLSGMGKSAMEVRKNFLDEANGQFDQEPSQISDYKVIRKGLETSQPVFEYTSTVILSNFVKKAGNGYIMDAGKLAGTFLQLEEKDRKRTLDVYMPCARSFVYNIVINIPAGFKVTGAEEFNKQKSNATGSFVSSAQVKGGQLVISATRIYKNNFEKASSWPLVAEVVEDAFAFNNQKILLDK